MHSRLYNRGFQTLKRHIDRDILKYGIDVLRSVSPRRGMFQPLSVVRVVPYEIEDEVSLSQKDLYILDYFLEWGNKPTHAGGLAKGIALRDRSGKVVRNITRKHTSDRCRFLEEMGILEHVSRKPPRGAYSRTPHYYLSERIEAFQILVDFYLNRGSMMRKLTFMHSSYVESAIDKNLTEMLVRFLVPEEKDRLYTEFFLLLIRNKLKRGIGESGADDSLVDLQVESSDEDAARDLDTAVLERFREVLDAFTAEDAESEILSLFEELKVFTEDQKKMYADILRLSPSALHTLVFLPIPKLIDQYEELGLIPPFAGDDDSSEKEKDQAREWRLLNKVMCQLLYCSMISDVQRFPFLAMSVDKRHLLQDVIRRADREGLLGSLFFSPRRLRRTRLSSNDK